MAASSDAVIAERLDGIYRRFKTDQNGCMIPRETGKTTTGGYGRCFLRYPGHDPVNTTLHRAVYILEKRQPNLIRNKGAGEVSHRCGNKTCVQVGHLILESHSENCLRRRCHEDGQCYGDHQESCIILKSLDSGARQSWTTQTVLNANSNSSFQSYHLFQKEKWQVILN